jgi:hypothetical protein
VLGRQCNILLAIAIFFGGSHTCEKEARHDDRAQRSFPPRNKGDPSIGLTYHGASVIDRPKLDANNACGADQGPRGATSEGRVGVRTEDEGLCVSVSPNMFGDMLVAIMGAEGGGIGCTVQSARHDRDDSSCARQPSVPQDSKYPNMLPNPLGHIVWIGAKLAVRFYDVPGWGKSFFAGRPGAHIHAPGT